MACCWRWLATAIRRGGQRVGRLPALKKLVVVIAGPTGVGKSDTAVELAKRFESHGRKAFFQGRVP